MKKFILVFIIISIILCTGCSTNDQKKQSKVNAVKATLDINGNIIINKDEIDDTATFLSYEVDGVTIGFIVVKGTDGDIRVAFNTCQSCNPSPNAYFIQKGEYFECQNCGNRFHVDQIGVEKGGCNPAPVEKMVDEEGTIKISSEYAKTYKENFENWNGPKA